MMRMLGRTPARPSSATVAAFGAVAISTAVWWTAATGSEPKPATLSLTHEIPACREPPGRPLPDKYYTLAKKWKEFRWVYEVKPGDKQAGGEGWERVDGSGMREWYQFEKLDINGDGLCDWFVTTLIPYSTGGDSGVLNTIYLGSPAGWKRSGITIPEDRPDSPGQGESDEERREFSYSEQTPSVVRDRRTGTVYLIGSFPSNRISSLNSKRQYGYHIYVWDPSLQRLRELDKWAPGSIGAQVYAFFKGDDIALEEVEDEEFKSYCNDEHILAASPHFAELCQQRQTEDESTRRRRRSEKGLQQAIAALKRGDWDAAYRIAGDANRADPYNEKADLFAYAIRYAVGNYRMSPSLKISVERFKNSLKHVYLYGLMLEASSDKSPGNIPYAVRAYKTYLERAPASDPLIEEVRTRLADLEVGKRHPPVPLPELLRKLGFTEVADALPATKAAGP